MEVKKEELYEQTNFTKPPQKHKAIINEWIDSGGKKTIQQREFNSSLNIYVWTDDRHPTWLAEHYRFKPEYEELVELECVVFREDNFTINVSIWPTKLEYQKYVKDFFKSDILSRQSNNISVSYWNESNVRDNKHLVVSRIRKVVKKDVFKRMLYSVSNIIPIKEFNDAITEVVELSCIN
jgi:hypothetical protein